jgi:broad specificity phosphatase PhoE
MMMTKRSLVILVLSLLVAAPAAAQSSVFLVRHAERADSGMAPASGADPDLSEAGKARAQSLAALLKDANITTIFTTEFKRTQQTAAPLGKALGISVVTVPSKNTVDLVKQIKAAKGNVLVVGHSNSVPDIIRDLGVSAPVTIADDEFDNLFIVSRDAPPSLLRLHYR